jgi:hypothetical protein
MAFVLQGLTGLLNLAWIYHKLHRAVESNAQLRDNLHNNVMNGLLGAFITISCGLVAWLVSKPLGKFLANGLGETRPATPVV